MSLEAFGRIGRLLTNGGRRYVADWLEVALELVTRAHGPWRWRVRTARSAAG